MVKRDKDKLFIARDNNALATCKEMGLIFLCAFGSEYKNTSWDNFDRITRT